MGAVPEVEDETGVAECVGAAMATVCAMCMGVDDDGDDVDGALRWCAECQCALCDYCVAAVRFDDVGVLCDVCARAHRVCQACLRVAHNERMTIECAECDDTVCLRTCSDGRFCRWCRDELIGDGRGDELDAEDVDV